MNKKGNGAALRIAVLVIAAAMFLYSGYRVAAYLLEGRKSQDVTAELIQQAVRTPQPQETKGQPVYTLRPTPDAAEYVPDADDETADEQETTHTAPDELLSVDFDTLQSVNPDIQAWLYMSGSSIHSPVLQAEDNSTYLYRLADGSSNAHGSLFIDCRNAGDFSDWNTLIYGHNMKDGSMFAYLGNYYEKSAWENNPLIFFDTLTESHVYKIFAVFKTSGTDNVGFAYHQMADAKDEAEFNQFVATCKELAFYDTGITPVYGDKLLCLSTCEYTIDNGRFVVAAVRIT